MTLARSGLTPPNAWTLSYPPVVLGGAHAEIRPEEEDMGEVLTKHTIGRVQLSFPLLDILYIIEIQDFLILTIKDLNVHEMSFMSS